MRAPQTKKKKRGEHQKPASHDDEDKNKASAEPPSKVRAIGARRHVRVKKKKREKETQQKEKHQTTNKKDATTDHGKTRYGNQVCYGPMRHTYRIHRYIYVDEKTKYVAKEGAQGTTPHAKKKKRTTNRHARQKARPQTQTTTIYPPYLFLHRPRPPKKKKNSTKAQKVWGGHGQRGNNEKANKRTFTNHEETTVRRASMLTIRGRAPKGRTTHTRTHINKTARSEKTETRARKNKV